MKIRSRANSAAAVDTVKSFLLIDSRKNSFQKIEAVYTHAPILEKKRKSSIDEQGLLPKMLQNRSVQMLTTVTLPGSFP